MARVSLGPELSNYNSGSGPEMSRSPPPTDWAASHPKRGQCARVSPLLRVALVGLNGMPARRDSGLALGSERR
jgi:hypothetical protein